MKCRYSLSHTCWAWQWCLDMLALFWCLYFLIVSLPSLFLVVLLWVCGLSPFFEEVHLRVLHVVSFQICYPILDQCSSLISAGFHGHNHRQDLVSASSSIYLNSDLILVTSQFQSWSPLWLFTAGVCSLACMDLLIWYFPHLSESFWCYRNFLFPYKWL